MLSAVGQIEGTELLLQRLGKTKTWHRSYRSPADQDHRLKIENSPHDPATRKKRLRGPPP